MRVIKRNEYESLDDISLIWTCMEPIIQQIRGQNFTVKAEAYTHLNASQQALLAFQILYGHTIHGVREFYDHLAYLLVHMEVWSVLKNGMQFFGDEVICNILVEMEKLYNGLKKLGYIEGSDLQRTLNQLDESLQEQIPASIKLMGEYIRNHPGEFLVIEDS